MDALEALRARHAVRFFQDKPVSQDLLLQIVDVGRLAATARNEQPWAFVVVTQRKMLQSIAESTSHGRFIGSAAACIAVFCHVGTYYLEDGCAATQNMMVAAAALGIGTCWIAGDKKEYATTVGNLLGVPSDYKLVSLIAVGYEAEPRPRAPKKKLSEVLHWEGWNGLQE